MCVCLCVCVRVKVGRQKEEKRKRKNRREGEKTGGHKVTGTCFEKQQLYLVSVPEVRG